MHDQRSTAGPHHFHIKRALRVSSIARRQRLVVVAVVVAVAMAVAVAVAVVVAVAVAVAMFVQRAHTPERAVSCLDWVVMG